MSKEFIWTDELVKEFIIDKFHIAYYAIPKEIQSFKASHQPKEDKPEWEIYAYKKDERIITQGSYDWAFTKHMHSLGTKGIEIYRVHRVSDGEVFSVGDEVAFTADVHYGKYKPFTINSFQINDMLPKKRMFCNDINVDIRYLTKSKPKEELKEPDRIEVSDFGFWGIDASNELFPRRYTIYSKLMIPYEKFPAIKQAIEQVLNDDDSLAEKAIYWCNKFIELQNQVNKMMERAFHAAREGQIGVMHSGEIYLDRKTYPTFQDYLSSIKH